MRISHRHRFVYVAVPRTGSTTVRSILDPHADVSSVHISRTSPEFPFYHHITAAELKALFLEFGWDWDAYFKFAVVRNPYDRVVSLFHHWLGEKRLNDPSAGRLRSASRILRTAIAPRDRFSQYVRGLPDGDGLARSTNAFVCSPSGEPLVDEILKFEALSDGLQEIGRRIGLQDSFEQTPHLNKSKLRGQYRKYYDESTREIVARLYASEIEQFGYVF